MEESPSYTEQIMDLIAKDKIKEAIQETQNLLKGSPKFYEVTLQSARYREVTKSIQMGLLNYDDAAIQKNKIRFAIMDMLRDLEDSREENPAIEAEVQTFLKERAATVNTNTANITGSDNFNIQGVSDNSSISISINKNPKKEEGE